MNARELTSALGGRWYSATGTGKARCPAHDDHDPSLELKWGRKQEIILICRAGCSQESVIGALKSRGLWTNGEDRANKPRVVATFDYTATDGTALRKHRWEPGFSPDKRKSFSWQHRENGEWRRGKNGKIPRLYRFENIEAAGPDDPILITESEHSADLLSKLGLFAVSPGGSTAWKEEHAEGLAGHRVAILPDNDGPGRDLAKLITRSLAPVCRVATIALEGLPEGEGPDCWPHLNGSADQLREIIEAKFSEVPRAAASDEWARLSDIRFKNVEFLWRNRFVADRINVIAGMGEVGKDVFCCARFDRPRLAGWRAGMQARKRWRDFARR
jgi:putative DNA primase/helicase